MKFFLVATAGCILGLAGGFEIASRQFYPKLRSDIRLKLGSMQSEQRFATILSLGALNRLEAGETDKAKSLLARQIADYYRSSEKYEASLPEKQTLLPFIDATSAKSAVLREELHKERK